LWEPHHDFPKWSWYQVLRSWLIEKYDFALIRDIMQQFPGLQNDPRYVQWKEDRGR
jgi:hypothetical protein